MAKVPSSFYGSNPDVTEVTLGAEIVAAAEAAKTAALAAQSAAETAETNAETSATSAASSASSASTSAADALASETAAATALDDVQTIYDAFRGVFYGSLSADPPTDPLGNAPDAGDLYYNTATGTLRQYDGAAWSDVASGGGGGGTGDPASVASDVMLTPTGNISSINVQSAIAELDTEKAALVHTHTKSQITDFAHSHTISDLPVATSGTSSTTQIVRADDSRLSNARTPTAHNHPISDVTGLQTALDNKAASVHTHTISDVTGLQTALDGKSDTSHTHTLDALSDVATTGASSGQALVFDGSSWGPGTVSGGSGSDVLSRARMTVSGAPGVGTITLDASTDSLPTFADAGVSSGDTVSYVVVDGSNWEYGSGTYFETTTEGGGGSGSSARYTNVPFLLPGKSLDPASPYYGDFIVGRTSTNTLKVPGVDTMPSGMTVSGDTVYFDAPAAGLTIADWDFGGFTVEFGAGANDITIEQCRFTTDKNTSIGVLTWYWQNNTGIIIQDNDFIGIRGAATADQLAWIYPGDAYFTFRRNYLYYSGNDHIKIDAGLIESNFAYGGGTSAGTHYDFLQTGDLGTEGIIVRYNHIIGEGDETGTSWVGTNFARLVPNNDATLAHPDSPIRVYENVIRGFGWQLGLDTWTNIQVYNNWAGDWEWGWCDATGGTTATAQVYNNYGLYDDAALNELNRPASPVPLTGGTGGGGGGGTVMSTTLSRGPLKSSLGAAAISATSAAIVTLLASTASGGGGGGAATASELPFSPVGNIAATNVQSALQELDSEKAASSHTHAIADVTGLQTALDGKSSTSHTHTLDALSDVDTTGAGVDSVLKYNGTTWVIGTDNSGSGGSTVASGITVTPAGNIASTNVQAALQELDTEKSSTSHTHTLNDLSDVDTTGTLFSGMVLKYDGAKWAPGSDDTGGGVLASEVDFTPSNNLQSINVQAALQELDAEKAAAVHSHTIADLPVATSGTSSTTQLVRADDLRLSDARTPTTHSHPQSQVTNLVTDLAAKAPLASPALTGTPTINGTAVGSMALHNVTISTSAPTGGSDGDFWAQVT